MAFVSVYGKQFWPFYQNEKVKTKQKLLDRLQLTVFYFLLAAHVLVKEKSPVFAIPTKTISFLNSLETRVRQFNRIQICSSDQTLFNVNCCNLYQSCVGNSVKRHRWFPLVHLRAQSTSLSNQVTILHQFQHVILKVEL